MGFKYNAKGLKPQAMKDYSPVPDGKYLLKIKKVEQQISKQGNDMVQVDCVIDSPPQFLGKTVRTYVTFLPPDSPGAGLTLHFLKCIGEPFDTTKGDLDIEPERWKGRSFYSELRTKPYNGKDYNYCTTYEPGPDADPSVFAGAANGTHRSDDEPPF